MGMLCLNVSNWRHLWVSAGTRVRKGSRRKVNPTMSQKRIKPERKIRPEVRVFPDDGQPRVSSRALAEMLGITHEEMLTRIEADREQLLQSGPLVKLPIPPDETSH